MSSATLELEWLRGIIDDAVAWLQDSELGPQAQQLAARRPECLVALRRAMADLITAEEGGEASLVEAANQRVRTAAAALRFVSDLDRKTLLFGDLDGEEV